MENPATSDPPLVTICIPHWQVREMMTLCLRSIRQYTTDVSYEVLVVDNGSKDDSLEYLRSIPWIRLIERGDQTPDYWVLAMGTALDYGIREGRGKYLLILHSDVIFKQPGWLSRLVRAIESDPRCAAAGTGKLELPSPLYAWWKRALDIKQLKRSLRRMLRRERPEDRLQRPECPRDFCALYRLDVLRDRGLSFRQQGRLNAAETMYVQLKSIGYHAAMIPVPEMAACLDHVAHGTAGLRPAERRLGHAHTQRKTERRLRALFAQPHVEALRRNAALDR